MPLGFASKLILNLLAVAISLLATIYWVKIYKQLYKKDKREVRGWCWLFVGVLSILLFNIVAIYSLLSAQDAYVDLNIAKYFPKAKNPILRWSISTLELFNVVGRTIIALSMTAGAYLLYAPMRRVKGAQYRFVPITPAIEDRSDKDLRYDLKASSIYLVREEKNFEGSDKVLVKGTLPAKSLEVFADLVTHNRPGLIITRIHPQKLRDRAGLSRTPILWLTQTTEFRGRISPNDLLELSHTIREFARRTQESVILLDGIEYLITQNSFDEILRFLQALNDMVSVSSSLIIIPVDPSAITAQQMHLLEREINEIAG